MDEYYRKLDVAIADLNSSGLWRTKKLPFEMRFYNWIGFRLRPLPYSNPFYGGARLALLCMIGLVPLFATAAVLAPGGNILRAVTIAASGSLIWGGFLAIASHYQGKLKGLSKWNAL